MAIALNMTVPLKQDAESQQKLQGLIATFADNVQPAIDRALSGSEIVHFARVLVIDNKYLQVLTEFDGDPMQYTEFFRQQLTEVFKTIFSLVEGAPPWDELNDPTAFFKFSHDLNLKALGRSSAGDDRGWLFSAVGDTTVREIKTALRQPAPTA
jgi:hypothetical protein